VQKVISAVVALFVVLGSLPAFAQASPSSEASRKAELVAAWQAASAAGAAGPKDVSLIDQAALKLPAGHFFVPQAEGARVLRALGNVVNDTSLVGLIVGTGPNDGWIVVIRYIKEGYIKDDDAKNWNADELLKNLRDGAEETNKDRAARGFPELQVQVDVADQTGWIARVDFLDASLHLIIEIDSVIYHSSFTDRRHDAATTARLIAAGYTVLRFTEVEVFFEFDRVVAALRSAFSQSNVG